MPNWNDWSERDDAILDRVSIHPCTPQQLMDFFPCKTIGYRRIVKLRNRKRITHRGTAMINHSGRPQDVYCNDWKPKHNNLRHEVLLTDFLLLYPDAAIVRGYDVDRKIRPDAEMSFDNGKKHHFVELDTGHVRYNKLKERWKAYGNTKDLLLVVTSTQKRLQNLLKHSQRVAHIAVFTTLAEARKNPHGKIWIDTSGNAGSLPTR